MPINCRKNNIVHKTADSIIIRQDFSQLFNLILHNCCNPVHVTALGQVLHEISAGGFLLAILFTNAITQPSTKSLSAGIINIRNRIKSYNRNIYSHPAS